MKEILIPYIETNLKNNNNPNFHYDIDAAPYVSGYPAYDAIAYSSTNKRYSSNNVNTEIFWSIC